MTPTTLPQEGLQAIRALEFSGHARDLLSFDERDLELALKAVSGNPRDLAHFLRSCRAQ